MLVHFYILESVILIYAFNYVPYFKFQVQRLPKGLSERPVDRTSNFKIFNFLVIFYFLKYFTCIFQEFSSGILLYINSPKTMCQILHLN